MSNLSAEGAVVHEEDVKILGVVDNKLLEAVGKIVLGCVVRAVSDFGHLFVSSESSSHSVVDTWVTSKIPLGLLQLSANRPP